MQVESKFAKWDLTTERGRDNFVSAICRTLDHHRYSEYPSIPAALTMTDPRSAFEEKDVPAKTEWNLWHHECVRIRRSNARKLGALCKAAELARGRDENKYRMLLLFLGDEWQLSEDYIENNCLNGFWRVGATEWSNHDMSHNVPRKWSFPIWLMRAS